MSNGRIPDEVIEAVLKHHDIVDVVGKYVHLSKQGHYMKGLCPFHSEKTPSFTVTPEKQIYYCYGCHAGGNAIHFVMEIEGFSFGEAVRQMAEEAGIPIGWEQPSAQMTQQQAEQSVLYQAYELSAKWYHHILKNMAQGRDAMNYLRSRGFTDKWIDFFQIGFAPPMWDRLAAFLEKRQFSLPLMDKGGLVTARTEGGGYYDKFRDRIIFPITDFKGRVIAFAGRAMGDAQPKYLNSPETMLFNKSRSLYNFHHARPNIRKQQSVVLFEGYVDVIKAWGAGVNNGVATMGTALTEEHANLIRKNAEQAIVCYDGDSAGQAAAFKSIPILQKANMHVKIAMMPPGIDPDEFIAAYGGDRFQHEIIDGAVPAVKFKLLYARKNFNLADSANWPQYINTAVKLIAELETPVEREHYISELAAEFRYSPESIRQQLNEERQIFLKKSHDKGQSRDNLDNSWNNVMDKKRGTGKTPTLLRAYQNAETQLLCAMMHDREVAEYVEERLGDQFNVEAHAALAAYLYAFYAQGNDPDASRYLASLQDERLERAASSILMMTMHDAVNSQVIDDYIREIKKYPQQKAIEQKREEMVRAEKSGDFLLAAQIASEIITLEKQLKLS
ncbi:DNA primase [Paenibacillus contaminans]|uniref:DNA primase n=1 Tax=Paenibacillus contaminans TaxID=450362 RepID=A0A329MUX3_9BACL|nr:DNA primase [Paenibacillus contaminans]RAV21747.1 DNA primase [Paenibacillus contaminans]